MQRIVRLCSLSAGFRAPPYPPQRRKPDLRQKQRQRGAHPCVYGSGRSFGPDECARRQSSSCATRSTVRPIVIPQIWAKRPGPMPRPPVQSVFCRSRVRWERCPRSCQQAAAIRIGKTATCPLTALCACFDPPVSKSGLSHRMKKLEALAEDLRRRLEENAGKGGNEMMTNPVEAMKQGRDFVHLHIHTEIQPAGRCLPHRPADGSGEGVWPSCHCLHRPRCDVRLCAVLQGSQKAGIKPIIGCEVYVATRTRFDKVNKIDGNNHLDPVLQERDRL